MTIPSTGAGRLLAVVVLVLAVIALLGGIAVPTLVLIAALALAIVLG